MARQPADKPSKNDDSALIRELALLLDETSLTEIEIERAGLRVRVARNVSVAAALPAGYMPAAGDASAAAASASLAAADPAKHPGAVPSPMVGTAYWAPEPGAKPFVEVGTRVTAGSSGFPLRTSSRTARGVMTSMSGRAGCPAATCPRGRRSPGDACRAVRRCPAAPGAARRRCAP